MTYPEAEKLAGVRDEMASASDFIEWCNNHGIWLCRNDGGPVMFTITESLSALILRWQEIDPIKLENERRAMIAANANLNERG